MIENLDQKTFEKLIEMLILYKNINKGEDVYLNEECIKKAILFFRNPIPDYPSN